MTPEILRSPNFVDDAARLILDSALGAIQARGQFRMALSGGNTPKPVYRRLAELGADFDWGKMVATFGDERCVPPDDTQSNFRMVKENLLDVVPAPLGAVLRMKGEEEPGSAAAGYAEELERWALASGEHIFTHDLVLLGVGEDGHTASLFPGTEALEVTDRMVVANWIPKFKTHRLTMTYPLLNAARHVVFLVGDRSKEKVIDEIRSGGSAHPAERIQPVHGRVTWLLGY